MKQLAWVQFFSWFALFSMWIYTTGAVTEHIYQTTDTTSEAYNMGANQVGEMFANYNLIAALVAFLLPVLASYVWWYYVVAIVVLAIKPATNNLYW